MAYHHMSEYRDGTLGALMRQPGSVHEGSLGVLMRQPGSVHEGSLGVLMRQPGSVHEGSLGVLMRQPGSVHEGSLGVLMRQPGSVHEGSLGELPRRRIYTAASPYLQGFGIDAMKPGPLPGPSAMMMPSVPGMPAAARAAMQRAQALAMCQARCGRLPPIGRASCRSACGAQYATHGLGLAPASMTMPYMPMAVPQPSIAYAAQRAMERSRARAECQARCYAYPTAQRPSCLTTCSRSFPLSGFGADGGGAAAAAAAEAAQHATESRQAQAASVAATTVAAEAARKAATATHPTERAEAQAAASAAAAAAAEQSRRAQVSRAHELRAREMARIAVAMPVTAKHRARYIPWFAAARAPLPVRATEGTWRRIMARRKRHRLPVPVRLPYATAAAARMPVPVRVTGPISPLMMAAIQASHARGGGGNDGLGAAPTATDIAAKMAAATARGTCLKSCESQPRTRFGGCVSGCLKRFPLHGLGAEMTTTNWMWLAGGVALLGAVVFVATR